MDEGKAEVLMDEAEDHTLQEGTHRDMPRAWRPYREERLIQSEGRILLSEAFSEYIALTAGMSPLEIAGAFDEDGDFDDRNLIRKEIHFLAGVFLEGRIRTYARLTGGGHPIELPTSAWEIDDAVARFSTAALNADRPHDPSAIATHWIFVDNAEWQAAMDGLRESRLYPVDSGHDAKPDYDEPAAVGLIHSQVEVGDPTITEGLQPALEPWRSEILTIENVVGVTGLKRSTIYAKIAAGSFPKQIPIHGTRKGWRRGAIQDWLDALPS